MIKRLSLTLSAPYVGLRPFNERDALLFFGRKRNVEELLAKLLHGPRFLAVLGASGTGKSSLVRAGLIPALHRGATALPSSRRWHVVTIKPGNAPMANLAVGLAELGTVLGDFAVDQAPHFLTARLASSPLGLVEQFSVSIDRHAGEALLIFVDQFEEVFRYRQRDINEAEAFVKLLLRSAREPDVPIYVVVTMRADFLDKAVAFKQLPEAVNQGLYLTPRLDIEELRSVVTSPLRLVNGDIEPELVARLLNDLGGEDDLPVLQHALLRMWNRARSDKRALITEDDYRTICGRRSGPVGEARLQASIDNHATELYEALEPEDQRIARNLFVALVDESDGKQVRREQALPDLLRYVGDTHALGCRRVLEAYRNDGVGFLLPPKDVVLDGAAVVDIAHESLFRQWSLFQGWLKSESEDVAALRYYYGRAWQHAEEGGGWLDELDCPKALAWAAAIEARGNATQWAARYLPLPLDAMAQVVTYARESKQQLDAAEVRELTRLQNDLENERLLAGLKAVSANRLRAMSLVLAVVTLSAVVFAVRSQISEGRAELLANEMTAARDDALANTERAEKAGLIAEKLVDEVRKYASQAAKAASDATASASKALKAEAAARKEQLINRSKDIWMPLQFLGEEKEAINTPIGLLNLARSDLTIRRLFLSQAFSEPDSARRFSENPIAVLRAAVGVSSEMQAWMGIEVARLRKLPARAPEVLRALTLAETYLTQPGFQAVLAEIATAERAGRLTQLGEELVKLIEADPPNALGRLPLLADRLSQASKPGARVALAMGIEAIARLTTPECASEATAVVLAAVRRASGTSELDPLKRAFALCSGNLDDTARQKIFDEVIADLAASKTRDQRMALAYAAGVLAKTAKTRLLGLPAAAEQLRSVISGTVLTSELFIYGEALVKVGSILNPQDAGVLLSRLIKDILAATDSDQIRAFSSGVDAVSPRSDTEVVQREVKSLLEKLLADGSGSRRGLTDPLKVLAMLTRQLRPVEVDALVDRVGIAQAGAPEARGAAAYNSILAVLVPRASAKSAVRIADQVVVALDFSDSRGANLSALVEILSGATLPPDQARRLADALLARIDPELDADQQRSVLRALTHVAPNLETSAGLALLPVLLAKFDDPKAWKDPAAPINVVLALTSRGISPTSALQVMDLTRKVGIELALRTGLSGSLGDLDALRRLIQQGADISEWSALLRSSGGPIVTAERESQRKRLSDVVGALSTDQSLAALDLAVTGVIAGQTRNPAGRMLMDSVLQALVQQPGLLRSAEPGRILIGALTSSTSRQERDVLGAALRQWAGQLEKGSTADSAIEQLIVAMEEQGPVGIDKFLADALKVALETVTRDGAADKAARLLRAFEQSKVEERYKAFGESAEVVLKKVPEHQAPELMRKLLDAVARSVDPTRIHQLGLMAAVVGRNLPDEPASARMFVEFMKYPSIPLRDLMQSMRRDPAKLPPYGSSVPDFITALQRAYGLGAALNAPALQVNR